MANARLLSVKLQRFKSYTDETEIHLSPLTIILGRNNSGKSSIIQALLLLKQTLALPRPEVPLHLEPLVEALSLRELTSGWPAAGAEVPGPTLSLRWSSTVDVTAAWRDAGSPDRATLAHNTEIDWLAAPSRRALDRITELTLEYVDLGGRTALNKVRIASHRTADATRPEARFTIVRQGEGTYKCYFQGKGASKIQVELDHFIPYLLLDRRNVGPRDRQRSWHNAFLILFSEPLEDLKVMLSEFSYLGPMRAQPPSLYKPATVPPDDIGVSGEYAAQMLHARQTDLVHYLPPLQVKGNDVIIPDQVRMRSLVEGMNDVLGALGVDAPLAIDDFKDVGFRLLFGRASLQHVGRGLSYLMPVVQLGLIADPLRFRSELKDVSLVKYKEACPRYTHFAIEEPESHLHPKVQTRLAHWLVSLAMSRRHVLVETHSDHLVRRLRGLAARAKPGSTLEKWLLENVRVLHIEQRNGKSTARSATLTPQGSLEDWPADFMDEATGEEREIYDASLDKLAEPAPASSLGPLVEHDIGEEPNTGP
ncbi:AAA family ATPase [Sorangium sp. So ce1000]|uniref:AAA family ATPase n=1 Tax=Sorangium sp. So ce1000 TaxID=3133325 RepID=UPI003F642D8A